MRLFLLLVVLSVCLNAQSGAGLSSISGTVVDPSGAAVANAKVSVVNESKGIKRVLNSNSAGIFNAAALVPAAGYSISIEAAGFANLERKEIELQVGQNVALTLSLQVAGTATQVDVTESVPLVEDTKTDVSQVIDKTQIQELPINGRRFDSFVLLTPGVSNDGTFGLVSFRGIAAGNSFLTDGNDTTNQFYNEAAGRTRIGSQISQDAVQEFQVISAGYQAEFGRAMGGVVNTVTRSGTNDVHGTFYWFFRNRSLNARDRYANVNPPESRHQTGGSVGGAIKKDKLFYFFNTEIMRRNFPIASSVVRPGVVENGVFVGCGAPATPAQCSAINSILPRFFGIVPRQANQELLFGKLDWRPNDHNSVSASFNYLRFVAPNGIQSAAALNNAGALGNNADATVRVRYGRLSWTSIPTATQVNEFRFGWFKDRQFDTPNGDNIPPFGLLSLTVGGQANLGIGATYPRLQPSENRFQFADNFSWTHGKHNMKFGIDISNTRDYIDQLSTQFGSYTYATVTNFALDFSGTTAANKNYQSFSQAFGERVSDYSFRDWGFFAQDQWRVTRNLTFNYGLRYDYTQVPSPTQTNPDYPQTGRFPNFTGGIAPRAGLAYSLNNGKTVIRAGYGVFHARYAGAMFRTLFTNNGIAQKFITYNTNSATDRTAAPVWPGRLASSERAAGAVSIYFAGQNYRPPYTQHGDVAIEHQFTNSLALTVSYIWGRGFQMVTQRDLNVGPLGPSFTYRILDANNNQTGTFNTQLYLFANRVDTRYQRVVQFENGGRSWYDAMAVQLRKRMSKGFFASVAYTWSHAIDTDQGGGDDNTFYTSFIRSTYNGDWRFDKGNSLLDQRHRFTGTWVWQPKFTSRTDAFSRFVVNNWQLSGVLTLAAARPASAQVTVATGPPGINPAFVTTLNGFGTEFRVPFLPMNPFLTDPIYRVDSRISKLLPISERIKGYLNFEAFNLTNTPRDTLVNATAYTARAGVLTPQPGAGVGFASAGYPDGTNVRRAQVSLRLIF